MIYARRYLLTANSTSETVPRVKVKTPAAQSPEAALAQQQSDFVVILAALLCALICVFGLIAAARCAWLRRRAGGVGRATGYPSANKGLKKKVLQSLPKYTYDSGSAAENGKAVSASPASPATGPDCAICLAEYVDGEEIRVLPQCGHRFHVQCIDTWLGSHSSCPSCRQVLVASRCRKCGEFPTVSAASSRGSCDGSNGQTEVKPPAASTSTSTFLP